MTEVLAVIARVMGVVYCLGGVFLVFQARMLWFAANAQSELEKMIAEIETPGGADDVSDDGDFGPVARSGRGRVVWLVSGGVILALAGAALAALHRWAPWLLVALLIHQTVYIALYDHLSKRTGDPDIAPEASTKRAAVGLVLVAALAVYLARVGRLG